MATNAYMTNRKRSLQSRPQGMLWANNPGTIDSGLYVPKGLELGQTIPENATEEDLLNEFLILSDDNRSSLQFNPIRIEKRERMINGRMRSYHIADKLELSTSWNRIPSRSFESFANFREPENPGDPIANPVVIDENGDTRVGEQYTTDGGAGGLDLLNWYNSYKGSFFVYLAYDKYTDFPDDENRYSRLGQYNEILEMYISNFTYSVEKRGRSNYDFWNISVSLEEV
jgi:hypothetical protein